LFAVLPVILLSHHVAHPSHQTTEYQDKILHYTSWDVFLSTVFYVELYQIKKIKAHIFVCVNQLHLPNCSHPSFLAAIVAAALPPLLPSPLLLLLPV
jgi:hypothetical protein